MGGKLTLVSAPGKGSTFSFELTLPLVDAAAQPPAPRRSLDGLRVLVVHDNAAARAMTARALRDWKARPTEVPSLAEAVAASAAGQYDAVLIDDWLLNDADGLWQALRSTAAVDSAHRAIVELRQPRRPNRTQARTLAMWNSPSRCASASCIEF